MGIRILLLILSFVYACGKDDKDDCKVNSECDLKKMQPFSIQGSISGAFDVKVDGKRYDDIESFYSSELDRLPAKLEKAGYKDYSPDLQAELGFKDLTENMDVFIAPMENRGYASKTSVGKDNTFKFRMPAEAAGDVYQFRAVKRIALVLSKSGAEDLTFCYNFSASETEVPYEKTDKPVVLSEFDTKITEYDCDSAKDKEDGIDIPSKD